MMIKTLFVNLAWWMQSFMAAAQTTDTQLQQPATPPAVVAPSEAPATAPQVTPPKDAAQQDPPVAAEVPKPQAPAEVIDLLDRLEKSNDDLAALTADVQYEKEDALLGRKELRTGNLIYQQSPAAGDSKSREKSFAVLFENTIIANVKREDSKHYIFKQRWLVEIDFKNKQFIKREIVPPGSQLDPLKLGEGPIPLPIGQKKEDVLKRFDVTNLTIPEKGLLSQLKDVEGLLLIPKPGVKESKDYSRIEVFFDKATLLPIGVNQFETNGDRKTVRLQNFKRNPTLTDAQLKRLDITEPDPREWHIDVQPLRSVE